MKKIYFTRHGQSQWNVENKICGATDIPLTTIGHKQAIETGKKIKESGVHIDQILYSPLMRAADTAKHISEMTGIPAISEVRLFEQNFGKYEGTPRDGKEFRLAKKSLLKRNNYLFVGAPAIASQYAGRKAAIASQYAALLCCWYSL